MTGSGFHGSLPFSKYGLGGYLLPGPVLRGPEDMPVKSLPSRSSPCTGVEVYANEISPSIKHLLCAEYFILGSWYN